MNAYDNLPPLSLATLGSPIWTIYSSKKPMRIQSYWSLCPQQVVLLQKLRVHSKYQIGDHVYLDTEYLHLGIKRKGRSAKFYPRFTGPFEIIDVKPETSIYKLQLPPEYSTTHPTFHAKWLKLAIDNDNDLFPAHTMPKPPPVIDGADDEYEIEYIRDHRDTAHGWQYLVHWLGYPDTDDEWIHEGNIDA